MAGPKLPQQRPPKTRVTVTGDVHIYTGLASAPYRRGDTLDLDPAHAEALQARGHVIPETTTRADSTPSA